MVEGDSVYLEQERQKVANVFCDGYDLHWSEVVESLGEGDDGSKEDCNDFLWYLEADNFTEQMYTYGKENLIKVNIYIRYYAAWFSK